MRARALDSFNPSIIHSFNHSIKNTSFMQSFIHSLTHGAGGREGRVGAPARARARAPFS